mgnify:CR=1 FL=1
MADQDIKMLIERIMAEARTHQSARFSNEVYADEPILKTGRQMQNFLPDQYRKMREISRWQEDPKGGAGRWLSEAELFYRQGLLMADFEDDCPYNGTFKSYFPTYNAAILPGAPKCAAEPSRKRLRPLPFCISMS